ncbi:DUF3883 domain-containing protein [Bacillus pacificus]|uniref:DUF3883 domain-containing protein n=1 Tax=Bacillus cereus group TaxID=86661 RepID=UPI000937AA7A|nr:MULTISPECIES: DUF3883 domain-containing protein [Bacillus cereus group]ASI77457.1 hypothetical protein BA202_09495 [Bacillus cereus]MCC2482461.1 DUF3883 domain-containing protein [Bacillus pacificus]MDA1606856.1 DUF3883 domain-containing protein [Bacillus cereus group sp. TH208-1LC]MED1647265.1 DUF3883 domain-containing protein [Bacillus pacificus]
MDLTKMEGFIGKIEEEAPPEIKTSIGNSKLIFNLLNVEEYYDAESILEYNVNIDGIAKVFQIQCWKYDGPNYRFEIRTPDVRAYQITCFHFNILGFLTNQEVIKIEQVVKVSGQNSSAENKKVKDEACRLLNQEGLLIQREGKAQRWHIGTYHTKRDEWMYEQNTEGFLKNFLKVAIIMAHARGNRGFSLCDVDNQEGIKEIDSLYPKKLKRSVAPESFKHVREEWERIGLDGEKYIFKKEKQRLIEAGRKDLAKKIIHISLEDCAAGYDILSYEADGRPRFIECKTTKGIRNTFEMSVNEWDTARRYREQYYIYQVKQIYDNPIIKKIQDPFGKNEEKKLRIEPSAFVVTFKDDI